jgi:PAS domain S-box-containing protein
MMDNLIVLASDWYWEQDAQFRYTRVVEPAQPHVEAKSLPSCIGLCRWELPDARALTMTWEEHRALLAARRSFNDFQHVFRDGDADRCVSVNGEPVFDAAGAFTGYRGTSRDVTDDWRQRALLRDAQALLGVAAVLGRFGAWSIDVRTGEGVWTEQARAIHQSPLPHRCTSQQVLDQYAPEYREGMREAFSRCAVDGTPYDLEVEVLTAPGSRTWVRVIGIAARDEQGRIVRVQGAYQGIDASKKAAEEHRALAEQLRTTLDSLTDGFGTVDRAWRITYLNDAALAILRLTREVVGMSFWEVFPQLAGGPYEEHYRRAMEHGEPRRFDGYYEAQGMWFRASAFRSGEGIAVSFTDITAAVQAREAMQRMNQELELRVQERTAQLKRLNEELSAFTLAVAHDLRAPLAGIGGFVDVIADRLRALGDEKLGHYIARVQHGVGRMEDQLEALLELSRIGRTELQLRPVDLSALACDALEGLRAADPERQVEATVQEGLRVSGDPRLLRTLIDNLVGNAWKFSAARQRACIAVGRNADGTFFVRDNGAGFDMAHAADLFAPFRRLHTAREFPGVGVGLASARRVVERHGGSIRAESVPDQGTVFWFTLPQP